MPKLATIAARATGSDATLNGMIACLRAMAIIGTQDSRILSSAQWCLCRRDDGDQLITSRSGAQDP
jgi:hypothetical protein